MRFVTDHQSLADDLKQPEFCREMLATLTDRFFKSPSQKAVLAVKNLSVTDDQNELGSRPMVKEWTWADTLLPLLPQRRLFAALRKRQEAVWPEGALALAPSHFRIARNAVLRLARWRARVRRNILRH